MAMQLVQNQNLACITDASENIFNSGPLLDTAFVKVGLCIWTIPEME